MSTTFFDFRRVTLARITVARLMATLALSIVSFSQLCAQQPATAEAGAALAEDNPSQGFLPANGFAKYAEFDKDLYIAALFLPRPANDPAVIRNLQAKRMELKIVHERLAYKRFGQLLIKSSAINNPPKMLVENARAMERFLKVFRDNLVRGDHIVLASQAGGFRVSLNGIELAQIESPDLFNMLLNIWIGDVPPSRDFRGRILGGDQALEFASDFANLEFSTARLAEITRWKTQSEVAAVSDRQANGEGQGAVIAAPVVLAANTPSEPALAAPLIKAAEESAPSSSRDASEKTAAIAPTEVDKASTDKNTEAANSTAPALTDLLTADVEPQTAAPRVTSALLSRTSSARTLNKEPSARTSNKEPSAQPSQASLQRSQMQEEASSNDSFSAENLLSVQLYVSKLLVHSQSKMKYPTIARRLGHQGKVVVSVTVNREGKLKAYEITDESENKSLNVAVTKGIKRSEPFPAVPESIEGDDFTFSVPVNFRISG